MKNYDLVDDDIEGNYRYSLTAKIHGEGTGTAVVIQCNPSKAKKGRSDPTVGKVCNWALEKGYARVIFVNLYALIATKPPKLLAAWEAAEDRPDIIGPCNDAAILAALSDEDVQVVIYAWGATPEDLGMHEYARRNYELHQVFKQTPLLIGDIYHVGSLSEHRYYRHGLTWNAGDRDLRKVPRWVE